MIGDFGWHIFHFHHRADVVEGLMVVLFEVKIPGDAIQKVVVVWLHAECFEDELAGFIEVAIHDEQGVAEVVEPDGLIRKFSDRYAQERDSFLLAV